MKILYFLTKKLYNNLYTICEKNKIERRTNYEA